ncbi:hypothetical protein MLD38_015065 [Melastoma candidum]|uniref:Uncharacterized protein n=1 Tax=Melastoma candidum TaxID=119954 RepID=A0ACB9REJ3_9MYRT|nr:hypothetical protein MLD38_015065 [Melastoma candidum]
MTFVLASPLCVKSNHLPPQVFELSIAGELRSDPESIDAASRDYGNIVREFPSAVMDPLSVRDVRTLVSFVYGNGSVGLTLAARGRAHSVRGQAMACDGIVINMTRLVTPVNVSWSRSLGHYADVGGQELWIDVLKETLRLGLSPVSWTDYLYLTVGGTLSNAGIGGQAFRYGPQISNVHEMDVITGKGELVTCSKEDNPELFYAVLGGLGQFGIITRARIALDRAPTRVKWIRMLYTNFSDFSRDQEHLISSQEGMTVPDYVEGLLLMHETQLDDYYSAADRARIMPLITENGGLVYSIELIKYYNERTKSSVDLDVKILLEGLNYVPEFAFERDASYVEFLDRVHTAELELQSQGLWNVPHPWLNLFVPSSRMADFDVGVFKNIVLKNNITTGPLLVYPMNRNKWNDQMSAVTADEDVFYTVAFLHSSGFDQWQPFDAQNEEVIRFCKDNNIKIKQYLPHYTSRAHWANHFGSKWDTFRKRKLMFDPKNTLSPGQRIFNSQ